MAQQSDLVIEEVVYFLKFQCMQSNATPLPIKNRCNPVDLFPIPIHVLCNPVHETCTPVHVCHVFHSLPLADQHSFLLLHGKV
jgi:hypothetical protein